MRYLIALILLCGCASNNADERTDPYDVVATPPQPQSPPASALREMDSLDDATLTTGMTFDDVEARWGDTDCIYQTTVSDQALDGWGYRVDVQSGEVVGLEDCRSVGISLFFSEGRLVAWGEH